DLQRQTIITSILPDTVDSFPWAGHLGLHMAEQLVAALDIHKSTLIFTNTRSQAERWYQALQFLLPEEIDRIALHHGSIAVEEREAIEAGLKAGHLKWVVCTSSLDLGVDFQPVERVVQIGSAKNLARLLQRAGRSAHVPAGTSEIFFLPTHALELLEIAAFRHGLALGDMEARRPLRKPYDVLVQHLVTLACGDGFIPEQTLAAIQQTVAYADLTAAEFDWILNFITQGGKCLSAYPRYKKVVVTEQGLYRVTDRTIARLHRMGIGTITANQTLQLVYTTGKKIGTIEESFISKLEKGDVFFFAGKQLEFFMVKDMTAYVKATTRKSTVTPIWGGGNLAISDILSHHLRQTIAQATALLANSSSSSPPAPRPTVRGTQPEALSTQYEIGGLEAWENQSPELRCILPLLMTQQRLSHLPQATDLLIETCKTREGQHLYVFPFAGRFVHEGLGFLWAYRFACQQRSTFTISVNDYGFEILAPKGYPFRDLFSAAFFDHDRLPEDLRASLNISELTGRTFRGIAQIAGLVFKGYPGAKKTASQLQVSASLIYEVFTKYEPDNLLLRQAEQEVLDEQLELSRLAATLDRLRHLTLVWKDTRRPSPFAFPLLVERLGSRLSNESLLDRIQRLKQQWDDR
ncbi:MAG: helicase-related protein, partial [Cyanobacteria bacterium]|nr:helicase-related protein [Cyanobacteriota bacterium]